jgi:DNA-binding CsgD family transcriptional regulator
MAAEGMAWGAAWCQAVRAEELLVSAGAEAAGPAADRAVAVAGASLYAARARGRAELARARVLRALGQAGAAEDSARRAVLACAAHHERPWLIEALELLGGLGAELGTAGATGLIAAATAARAELGTSLSPARSGQVASDVAAARARSRRETFEADWAEGTGLTLEAAVARASGRRSRPKRPLSGWDSLTPAEAEVARLVALGHRNADIAAELFVSLATVKTHVSRALTKLGVSSRTELAALAARHHPFG